MGHVDDQGAPPVGGGGGHKAQHQPGHRLPPPGAGMAQEVLHDEAQAHPTQDDDQRPGGDAPYNHPGLPYHGVQVGQLGGSSGENVVHGIESLVAVVDLGPCGPLHHPAQAAMYSLYHPAGEGLCPPGRVQGRQDPVENPAGLVHGYKGVEDVGAALGVGGDADHQQVGLPGIQVGLLGEGRVLPRNTPSRPSASSRRPAPGT